MNTHQDYQSFWKCILTCQKRYLKCQINKWALHVKTILNCAIQKGKMTSYHSPSNFWSQLKVWWNHHSRGDRLWHHLYERKCWGDMDCMIQRDPRNFLDHKLQITNVLILKLFVIAFTHCMYHIIQKMHIILFKKCIIFFKQCPITPSLIMNLCPCWILLYRRSILRCLYMRTREGCGLAPH